MDIYLLTCDAKGRFQCNIDSMKKDSNVDIVVREEIEKFIATIKTRLSAIDPSDLDNEELSEFKEDILSVLATHLGGRTAKLAVSFIKKPTSWNMFFHDRYSSKLEELRNQEKGIKGMISFMNWLLI